MKATIAAIILIASLSTAMAQEAKKIEFDRNGRILVSPVMKKLEFASPDYSYTIEAMPANLPTIVKPADINVNILSSAYRPFFDPYTPMRARVSPYALDFKEASVLGINEKLSLLTIGRKETWPLLGNQTDLTSMLVWKHNNLTISGGAFVAKYSTPENFSPLNAVGGVAQIRYQLNEKIALRSWGQYTYYGQDRKNPALQYYNSSYNYTGVGGALEYMITNVFGLGGGVEYRFNYMNGRMEPHPVIYPIFNFFNIGK